MLELQFLKTFIFPRALWMLQNWVNFSIFSYLKFFSVFIINSSTILFSKPAKIKRWKCRNRDKLS